MSKIKRAIIIIAIILTAMLIIRDRRKFCVKAE